MTYTPFFRHMHMHIRIIDTYIYTCISYGTNCSGRDREEVSFAVDAGLF